MVAGAVGEFLAAVAVAARAAATVLTGNGSAAIAARTAV
jgi:hypothetical protein